MSPEKIATGRKCLLLSRYLLTAQSKSYISKVSGGLCKVQTRTADADGGRWTEDGQERTKKKENN